LLRKWPAEILENLIVDGLKVAGRREDGHHARDAIYDEL
jgi:hypothetical protein